MFTCSLRLCLLSLIVHHEVKCESKIRPFPENFEFGASTAAYQIEGGWNEDGKGESIWDVMIHMDPSPIADSSTGDIAADSYHLLKRDVEMMKELDLDFYRFSISWTRILPNGFAGHINQKGVDYYNILINELIDNGIKPFVTLYHWDLPETLQKLGGWANPNIVEWFVDYANVVFEAFGDRVQYWITINEPKQICYEGYGSDAKAPMLNMSGIAEYMCAKNVLLAHAKAYHLYDKHYRRTQNGSIGISISCTWYEPHSDMISDQEAAQNARQFDWGQYAHPIFSQRGDFPNEVKHNVASKSNEQGLRRSRLPKLTSKQIQLIRGTSDFFGMNTYTSKLARYASEEAMYAVPSYMDDMGAILEKHPDWPQGASSWLQSVPNGFYKLLMEVKTLYNNPPVFVTENGWSTTGGLVDDDRVEYYKNYLNALLDAVDNGSNVKAYTAWSLMDNFEWKNGYSEKFGLYEVDFSSPERTRTPRKSASVYKEIIRTRSLDPDYNPSVFNAMDEINDVKLNINT